PGFNPRDRGRRLRDQTVNSIAAPARLAGRHLRRQRGRCPETLKHVDDAPAWEAGFPGDAGATERNTLERAPDRRAVDVRARPQGCDLWRSVRRVRFLSLRPVR